jgi:hypothetical protein
LNGIHLLLRRLPALWCGLAPRPTSAPGLAQSAPDRWWRRSTMAGSERFTEDGVDFGDQFHHHRWVIDNQGCCQLRWFDGVG